MPELTPSEKDRWGKILIVCIVFLVVSLWGTKVYLDTKKTQVDEAFCPKEGLIAETVILFDQTDPLTSTQKEFLLKRLRHLGEEELEDFERLSLYGLGENRSTWNAAPIFSICNPGRKVNVAFEGQRKKIERYRLYFQEPLEKALNELLTNSASETSPIMEMIESISLRSEVSGPTSRRRLVIISDMMQNASGYSQYRLPINYDTFASTEYAKAQRISLNKVNVEIIYLEREGLKTYQNPKHISFWEQWFSNNGSKLIGVTPVR